MRKDAFEIAQHDAGGAGDLQRHRHQHREAEQGERDVVARCAHQGRTGCQGGEGEQRAEGKPSRLGAPEQEDA